MLSLIDPSNLHHTAWMPTAFGIAGFLIYAGADIALCLRRLTSEGVTFYLLNIAAACLIGTSLLHSFNLGAFLTELFCIATSCVAIGLRMRRWKGTSRTATRSTPKRFGARAMPSRSAGPGLGLCPSRID